MPKKFSPIQGSNVSAIVSQINRNMAMLDKEVDRKTYGGRNGTDGLTVGQIGADQFGMTMTSGDQTVLTIGKLPNGKIGFLLYDENNQARILIGQAPDDTIGMWVSKTGFDVLDLFS